MNQQPDDTSEFENLWWAMEQGLPGAEERLAAAHARRHDEWAPIRDALPKLPTVVACTAPDTLAGRLAAAPLHRVNAETGDEWGS